MKCTWFISIILIYSTSFLHAAEFYVSPNGNDSDTGSLQKPFATIVRAQKAVRETVKKASEPVSVFLRGGVYFQKAPIVFTVDDSGTVSNPVTYTAYPEETPIISGGIRMDCQWEPFHRGIFRAVIHVNDVDIDQLFVNGQRYRMARYPNFNPNAKYFGGTSGDAISTQRIQSWANPLGGYVHALHEAMWGSKHYRIVGMNEDGTLKLQGGWQENRGGGFDPFFRGGYHKDFLFVENIHEELDAPGEWFLDREHMILYVIPQPGDLLEQAEVIGAKTRELIVFQGNEQFPVHHILLKNLHFKHTVRIFMEPYERLLRGDWSIARLAAVRFQGTEDTIIEDCSFEDLGGNGVMLDQYNRRVSVRGCRFNRLGESGVCVVGGVDAVRSPSIEYSHTLPQNEIDLTPGPQNANYPAQCIIENNLMHDFGQIGKQTAGVFLSMSEEITVCHNTIYNCPRAAVCINDGCWGGHTIEFNDIFNTVRESGDHGPFNSWGRDRYWKTSYNGGQDIEPFAKERAFLDHTKTTDIRYNRFAHFGGHSWGIDLDDGSSNYRVSNNLCLGMGVKLREGFCRRVENNIIVQGFCGFHIWLPGCDDVVARNIIVGTTPFQFIRANPSYAQEIDHNLFYADGETPMVTGVGDPKTLADWQAMGFDEHSSIADPLFVNPESGDYRVKPDSPALRLGFQNFPMDQFGVKKQEYLREISNTPRTFSFASMWMETSPRRSEAKILWLGATIKNLSGEAEKSAAGMGTETGVLFMDVPLNSQAAQTGLKTGDVLIRFNDTVVDTVQDLLHRVEENQGRTASVTVFNAVERTIQLSID